MAAVMQEFDMKSPIKNNNLTEPFEFLYSERMKAEAAKAEAAKAPIREAEVGHGALETAAVLAVVNDWEEETA